MRYRHRTGITLCCDRYVSAPHGCLGYQQCNVAISRAAVRVAAGKSGLGESRSPDKSATMARIKIYISR